MAGAAALVSGCLGDPIASAKVDPRSPIAAEVASVAKTHRTYPKFSDIPPVPDDVRPARIYGERASQLKAARAELEAATAPAAWTLSNTQGFAAKAQSEAGPGYRAGAADTESFANAIRKRATPPPPATN